MPEGTGLGLAFFKEAVKAMSGEISAEATPGQSCVFTVRLPLKPSVEGNGCFVA